MSMPNEPQSAPAYQDRGEAFAQGHQMEGSPVTSPGLAQQQAQQEQQGPPRVRLTGSGLGMSAEQSEATMGGMLKPQNGIADDSYNDMKWQQGQQ